MDYIPKLKCLSKPDRVQAIFRVYSQKKGGWLDLCVKHAGYVERDQETQELNAKLRKLIRAQEQKMKTGPTSGIGLLMARTFRFKENESGNGDR